MKTSQSDYKWIIYVHVNVAIMLRDNMEGRTTQDGAERDKE